MHVFIDTPPQNILVLIHIDISISLCNITTFIYIQIFIIFPLRSLFWVMGIELTAVQYFYMYLYIMYIFVLFIHLQMFLIYLFAQFWASATNSHSSLYFTMKRSTKISFLWQGSWFFLKFEFMTKIHCFMKKKMWYWKIPFFYFVTANSTSLWKKK